ncbi:MAG: MFS transporter, partial [Thermomicrobiaceae bacterium]|nr:MFS transporter [Thermomicrobiaceae bacterium]
MPEPTAASAEPRRGRLTDVLRNRAFLRLWLVQALSQTGQNMINFALLVLVGSVVERGGISQANTAISFTVLSFSLPGILLSPVAGVVVERTNKRTALVVTNALRGLATVGFLMIDPSWRPLLALTVLYALAFISGGVGQFFGPALGATIPALVPERNIVNANALFNLTFTASQVAGFAALGPFLIKLFGLDTVFSGIIGTFALCTALSLTLPSTPPSPTRAPGPRHPFLQF